MQELLTAAQPTGLENDQSPSATTANASTANAATVEYPKFPSDSAFYSELRRRVADYFATTGRSQRDCGRMYVKTAIILCWFATSYALLVATSLVWWCAAPLAISLALSMAAIGFNVQHDGGHGAYSKRRWLNRLTAFSLDMLGGSSYVWANKHGLHHSYSNIYGHDDDINLGVFGRVAPHQPRRAFHRLQHFYLWALYGLLPAKWQLYDDYRDVITGRIGEHRFARPKGWDLALFLLGKGVFLTLAFVIPLSLHSLGAVLIGYFSVTFIEGIALSVVFQLPHCGEESAFPLPDRESGRIETPWAVHQVQTTVDYGRSNRLLTWYVGGLNYQIEHHLFPRICHIHYKELAPLVEATCRDFGVRYYAHGTFRAGLASHYRWLRHMGSSAEAR